MSNTAISARTHNLLCHPENFINNLNKRLTANTIVLTITAVALSSMAVLVLLATHTFLPGAFLYVTMAVATTAWHANGLFFASQYADRQILSRLQSRELAILNAVGENKNDINLVMETRIKLHAKQTYTLYLENAIDNLVLADNDPSDTLHEKKLRALSNVARKLNMNDPENKTLVEVSRKIESSSQGIFQYYFTMRHLFSNNRAAIVRRRSIKRLGRSKSIDFASNSPDRVVEIRKKELEGRYLSDIKHTPTISTTFEEAGVYLWERASACQQSAMLVNRAPICREYNHDVYFSELLVNA